MSGTVFKGFRLPAELAEALKTKSLETGLTQTEVLVRALERGLVAMEHPELQGDSLRDIYARILRARNILDDAASGVLSMGNTKQEEGSNESD